MKHTSAGDPVDLFVIGTGGAGVAAAIQAAGMDATVVIAEGGTLGGTCVNVGCIPSKTLVEAAAHVHAARRGFPGIAPCELQVDWRAVVSHKDALVDELREVKYADVLRSYPNVTFVTGAARLVGGGRGRERVRVGEIEYRARKILIATGSSPVRLDIPGADAVTLLDSTTAMTLDARPASMVIIGGGPVGVELGQIFARFGTKVSIITRGPRLLPREDAAVSAALREHLEGEGIEIHTNTTPTRFERTATGTAVHVTHGQLIGTVHAEQVLVAAGRRANTHELGLAESGVTMTSGGFVQVDATQRTVNADVYAAGDVTGGPQYVYVAAAGGRVAAENAVNALKAATLEARELDLSFVPNVTFTSPQVASVGLTEASARATGYRVEVSVLDMAHVPRAIVSYDTRGFVKLVMDADSGRLLGVHAIAPNAGEFMGEATLALRFGHTARDISETLHPYLTWIESLKLAAQGFTADVTKLSCCA